MKDSQKMIINLVDDLLAYSIYIDRNSGEQNKGGTSFLVHHLSNLKKEIIKEFSNEKETSSP